jgi:RimJ/RimL family protein N-acetyltransferase
VAAEEDGLGIGHRSSVAAVSGVSHAWEVLLRDAVLSDVPALIEVQQAGALQALTHIFPQDLYPFPRAAVEARWAAEILDPDVKVYVIEQDETGIVGFAAVRDNELLHFGTAVETWGSGLAAAAHRQVMQRLAATGSTRARLRVFEENLRARRFYEKLGWRCTDRISRTSFPPRPVLLEYELDLDRIQAA